ncbi:MAG: FeoB-associated Cys-rich membrane protein [Ruminococcaceae bacterium]|nr:FeoB-associated Cys-rich membrane protein [Oscillospiraceae bacterium]
MDTVIAVIIIAVIVGLAALYVYKAKKSGKKCIGCPYGGNCAQCHDNCGGNKTKE